jgi:EAL domain-containing protein (putative c-di-GMP-specific phosphodiesterase class I)
VTVEKALRDALDSGDLWAEFQPEVRIDDHAVNGIEALARCRSAVGELIAPEGFIAVAEEVGLVSRVFEAVLTQACAAAMKWNQGRAHRLVIWVILSPLQLGSRDLVDQIRKVIDLTGADPETLGFEVTERGILPDPLEAAHRLGDLAKLGSRLAVDDFGTGYSSLGYLRELPVDTVKLDQSFVVRAADRFRQQRSIAEAAKAKGVSADTVIAAVVNDASDAIDRSVDQGQASPEVAARAKARLATWAARLVYGTRAEFEEDRGRR